jgi:TonB family protein
VLRRNWVGQQIDHRLTLQDWLGTTPLGDIFRTELPEGKPAAVLIASADDENATPLLHNWQTAAALNHPHLLHVFEAARAHIEDSPVIYAVTELPEEALDQILPERPLTTEEVGQMLPPILDALAHLHAQDLVHSRIEPACILVVGDQLKLAPYSVQPASACCRGEARIYDAPETDDGTLTPESDIWSLGILVIEALTQHTPTWIRTSGRDPVIPSAIPQPFAQIASRCLSFDANQRCTLAQIRELLSTPAPAPAVESVAAAAPPAAVEQLPLFDEPAPEATHTAAPEAPRLRKSFRTIEEDEVPRLRLPIPWLLGGAAVLFVLIIGLVAYSRHGRSTLATTDQSTTSPAAAPDKLDKPIKPLPQPSGPTLKGAVAQRVIPEIPARAARGIRGKVDVKIKLTVDHAGNVINAAILSDGRSRYFANQALDAARKWRFRPAKIHGQPAASTWDLRFVFTKTGATATPTELTP